MLDLHVGGELVERAVVALLGGETVGLVHGDDAQPRESGLALWLAAQQRRPCELAGVLDQRLRRIDRAGDGTQQTRVVQAEQVGLVAPLSDEVTVGHQVASSTGPPRTAA